VWDTLNAEEQFWVADTLRGYIQQLRDHPPPGWSGAPGPFDETNKVMPCPPMWIFSEDGAGPFKSYEEMTKWFDTRRTWLMLQFYRHNLRFGGTNVDSSDPSSLPDIEMFDNTLSLTMSHGDLNMRNILLQRNPPPPPPSTESEFTGERKSNMKLWLIDWEFAGFYPASFEYAFMVGYSSQGLPKTWVDYIPFMLGERSMSDS